MSSLLEAQAAAATVPVYENATEAFAAANAYHAGYRLTNDWRLMDLGDAANRQGRQLNEQAWNTAFTAASEYQRYSLAHMNRP